MKIHERRFGSLERVVQSNESGWVGLDSLTGSTHVGWYRRLHAVLMEGLRRKNSESRSLFQRDSERHVDQTGYQWSDGGVILGIGR